MTTSMFVKAMKILKPAAVPIAAPAPPYPTYVQPAAQPTYYSDVPQRAPAPVLESLASVRVVNTMAPVQISTHSTEEMKVRAVASLVNGR